MRGGCARKPPGAPSAVSYPVPLVMQIRVGQLHGIYPVLGCCQPLVHLRKRLLSQVGALGESAVLTRIWGCPRRVARDTPGTPRTAASAGGRDDHDAACRRGHEGLGEGVCG